MLHAKCAQSVMSNCPPRRLNRQPSTHDNHHTKGFLMSPIIVGVSTSVTAFVGKARRGPLTKPVHLASFTEYDALFGGLQASSEMGYAIQQFFLNGGRDAWIVRLGKDTSKWMQALDRVDLFNLLCLPGVTDPAVLANAVAYCKQRRAFLTVSYTHLTLPTIYYV